MKKAISILCIILLTAVFIRVAVGGIVPNETTYKLPYYNKTTHTMEERTITYTSWRSGISAYDIINYEPPETFDVLAILKIKDIFEEAQKYLDDNISRNNDTKLTGDFWEDLGVTLEKYGLMFLDFFSKFLYSIARVISTIITFVQVIINFFVYIFGLMMGTT